MTGPDGRYELGGIAEGTYFVDFDLLGFDLTRRNHVRVTAGTTVFADARLSLTGVCECVTITPVQLSPVRSGKALADRPTIIHRDLKPANIKLRPDGMVKILDFGLAKSLEPLDGASLFPEPTTALSPPRTISGVILGTPTYLSPEQARGLAVDARTDIWAFGCVLFEMLAGRKPFAGQSLTDTLAAILKEEPEWQALPSGLPVRIAH